MKKFIYKVYDASDNFIKTWDDVVNEPSFSQEINSAGSELIIQLARKADDYGEEVDVKFGNIVKIYVDDIETTDPELLFQGYISGYTPTFSTNEYVEVTLLSFGAELDGYMLEVNEQPDQVQATGSNTRDFGPSVQLAQSFIPSMATLTSVDLKLSSSVPTTVTLTIHPDSSGTPSTSTVTGGMATKLLTDTSLTVNKFIFGTPPTLTPGSTYWVVIIGS